MALTPEGTPYVESTDLVANYPAASLSLADRVDLVGVLPFADAAARTAAIPTPTDGQFTYLQDTNTPEFYDGSNFVPVGTASGLVHIATDSFTAVSTVSLNDVFTSDYRSYRVMAYVPATTSNAQIQFRVRAAGSDLTTSTYLRQDLFGVGSSSGAVSSTITFIKTGLSTDDLETFACWDIVDIAESRRTIFTGIEGREGGVVVQRYTVNNTTPYDGITIFSSAGNMTDGYISVYGYSNS